MSFEENSQVIDKEGTDFHEKVTGDEMKVYEEDKQRIVFNMMLMNLS